MPRIVLLQFSLFVDCMFLLLCQISPMKAQSEGSVRLMRGSSSESGFVEIYHDNQWGRVCDTGWDRDDAYVVCKQQGYNGVKFPATNVTGQPNPGLPLVLDNLQCTGLELALASCLKDEWGVVKSGCQTAKAQCMSYAPQHIGCFYDDSERLLPDYGRLCEQGLQDARCASCDHTNKSCDSSQMTVELCIQICCNDNDFVYAGVEAGDECYCGHGSADYSMLGRVSETACNTQCSGNPQQSCGADYKIDVYNCSAGCEAPTVDKPNLETVPAVLQTTFYRTGQVLTFDCTPGYQLRGNANISCQPGGSWSAPVPDCIESTPCPYPTATPQSGHYRPVQVKYQPGVSVQLSCITGYQSTGSPSLTCQDNGTWTTEHHACIDVDCGPLPEFANANPSTSATTYDTTVMFTCDTGYQLITADIGKTCDASGSWAGEDPQCAAKDCGPLPEYPFVTPVTTDTVFATSVTFGCDDNYQFANGPTPFKMCNEDGEWVGVDPVCELSTCPPLANYSQAIQSTNVTVVSTVVTFSCEAGYRMRDTDPASTKTCTSEGIWEGPDPVCQPVDCGPLPEFSNANPSTSATTYDTTVMFTCDNGYQLITADIGKTCDASGSWAGEDPQCAAKDCGPLPQYPFVTPVTTDTVFATSVTFGCDDNYQFANGPTPVKTCNEDGEWVGVDPVCELSTCPPLANYSQAIQSTNVTVVSTVVTFSCEAGYRMRDTDPAPTKTCTSEGKWEGPDPVCQLVDCGPPNEAPADVNVSVTNYWYNGTVTYSCNKPDEVIQGNATLYCLSNGNWSADVPTCGVNSKGADSDPGTTIPFFVWILLLLLTICLILLIASYVVYRVHTRSYKKYKKKNSDNCSAHNGSPGVPLHGVAVRDPQPIFHDNYAVSHDEEGDTGVASNESDMQDVSLGSESNYRYLGNAYAESLHSGSVQPSGTIDSGMYASDLESNSLGMDVAGSAGVAHGAESEQAGEDRVGDKHQEGDKKDKDFIDDMLDSAKEKLDNCVIQ